MMFIGALLGGLVGGVQSLPNYAVTMDFSIQYTGVESFPNYGTVGERAFVMKLCLGLFIPPYKDMLVAARDLAMQARRILEDLNELRPEWCLSWQLDLYGSCSPNSLNYKKYLKLVAPTRPTVPPEELWLLHCYVYLFSRHAFHARRVGRDAI
eukprot:4732226-Amphidinium_carterae.1